MKKTSFLFFAVALVVVIAVLFYFNSAARFDKSDVLSCDASYLLDPNFKVTSENFSQCTADLFSAPAKLYYYFDADGGYRYSNSMRKNKKVAEVFADMTPELCSKKEFYDSLRERSVLHVVFFNTIGTIEISVEDSRSYIGFFGHDLNEDFGPFEMSETYQKFFVAEGDRKEAFLAVKDMLDSGSHSAAWEME